MKVLFCLILAVNACAASFAEDVPGVDHHGASFELSTDMLRFDAPTAEMFLGWQRNANALFQLGLDGVSGLFELNRPERRIERLGVLAVFTGASLVVNQAFSLTAHDQRHMDTALSIGSPRVYLIGNSGQQIGIGEFFVEAFNFTVEPALYVYDPPNNMTPEQETYVASAGLNTNLLIAENVSRKIDDGSGHVTDVAPYLLNKLWGIKYFLDKGPTSDASNYMALMTSQGHSTVTQQNVIALHAASCLLSGGFLSLMRGTYRFIAEADPAVEPLGLSLGPVQVFWPEVTTWLNMQNVSLQCTVDARWGKDLSLRAGVDAPVLGNTNVSPEVTVGAGVRIQVMSLGMELTSSFRGVPFVLGNAELAVTDSFSVGIEGFYGQGTTMREAREHPLGPGAVAFLKVAF